MGVIWNPSSSASGTVTGGSSEGAGQAVFDAVNSTTSTLYFKSLTSTDASIAITNTATTVDFAVATAPASIGLMYPIIIGQFSN